MKTKAIVILTVLLAMFAMSCRSAATATPDELDPAAIESAIRAQILSEYPGETFSIGVSVSDDGVVELTGTVNAEQQRRIPQLVQQVAGVTRIINRLGVSR